MLKFALVRNGDAVVSEGVLFLGEPEGAIQRLSGDVYCEAHRSQFGSDLQAGACCTSPHVRPLFLASIPFCFLPFCLREQLVREHHQKADGVARDAVAKGQLAYDMKYKHNSPHNAITFDGSARPTKASFAACI